MRENMLPVKFESSVMQVGNSLRITIPKEISKYLDIKKGDILELWTNNHNILIEKKKKIVDAIWGFQEDILELRKNLRKNIQAHASQPFGEPLHRYKGKLSITRNSLILEGEETETKQQTTFLFQLQEITDIHLGWDDTLRRWKDSRAYIKPLRLEFKNEKETRTLYLYTKNADAAIYGEENQEIFDTLQKQ
jgi:AbrB family looped-hinge helix DNA binding protein